MENQHRKISGYRELSRAEIDLMNEIKAIGPQVKTLLDKLDSHISVQIDSAHIDENADELERLKQSDPVKWMHEGATDIQKGLMALTRAVAQPTLF